jgi:hypothetical protein
MIGLLFVLLFQVQPPNPFTPAPPAQVVNETRVVNEVHVIPQPLDPEAVAEATVQSNKASMGMVVAPPVVDWGNELLKLPDIWRTTPPEWTYKNAAVVALEGKAQEIARVLYLLVLAGFAINMASGQPASIGRVFFAIVVSYGNLVWWGWLIDGNNAINAVIGAPDLVAMVRPHIVVPSDPVEQFAQTALLLVYLFVLIFLLLGLFWRLALIMMLIVVGPIAFLCYALPQTESIAGKYIHLAVGTVYSQVLIVVGLSLSQVVGGMLTGIYGGFLQLIVLLGVRNFPRLLASNDGPGRGMLSQLAGMMAVRRLAFR